MFRRATSAMEVREGILQLFFSWGLRHPYSRWPPFLELTVLLACGSASVWAGNRLGIGFAYFCLLHPLSAWGSPSTNVYLSGSTSEALLEAAVFSSHVGLVLILCRLFCTFCASVTVRRDPCIISIQWISPGLKIRALPANDLYFAATAPG